MNRTYIIWIFWLGLGFSVKAQAPQNKVCVTIEKTAPRSAGSILEFYDHTDGNPQAKGIILPIVDTPDAQSEQGTLLYDAQDDKVKYHNGTAWVDLTTEKSSAHHSSPNLEERGTGAIIADGSIAGYTTAPAVLKLDSNKRAMILPHVNDVTKDLPNPEAGTIAYDKKSKSLAIFNGDFWFFWNE